MDAATGIISLLSTVHSLYCYCADAPDKRKIIKIAGQKFRMLEPLLEGLMIDRRRTSNSCNDNSSRITINAHYDDDPRFRNFAINTIRIIQNFEILLKKSNTTWLKYVMNIGRLERELANTMNHIVVNLNTLQLVGQSTMMETLRDMNDLQVAMVEENRQREVLLQILALAL